MVEKKETQEEIEELIASLPETTSGQKKAEARMELLAQNFAKKAIKRAAQAMKKAEQQTKAEWETAKADANSNTASEEKTKKAGKAERKPRRPKNQMRLPRLPPTTLLLAV